MKNTPVILALGSLKLEDCELNKPSLCYTARLHLRERGKEGEGEKKKKQERKKKEKNACLGY